MKVVAVMTRAPQAPVDAPLDGSGTVSVPAVAGPKTRLAPALPDAADREALQRAMLADVLTRARAVSGAIVRVAVTPGGSADALADLGVAPGHVLTQQGESLGDRVRGVFADLFRRGARQVLVVGSDLPLLTTAILDEAFAALAADPRHVVLGPASDGGYYLLGLHAPQVPDLFTGVRWSTKYTLMDTLRRCEFEERRVAFLPILDDVDEPADLERLRASLAAAPDLAPHTAAAVANARDR
ncbi:TIGR04282 family arsenosugar biosynthesis glycosyltransferase [Luteitalea sp.]